MGCQSSFLDIKPNTQTVVPSTLEDFESLLYDENVFRYSTPNTLNMIGSDEYSIRDAHFGTISGNKSTQFQTQAYIWEKNIFIGDEPRMDWEYGYRRILQCNVALDGLVVLQINEQQREQFNKIKGMAIFHRAFSYYNLAQQFSPVYVKEKGGTSLGLPLRLTADPTLIIPRSTLEETYRRIEQDLLESLSLLPLNQSTNTKLDPTKQAAHALLVRLYMQMVEYNLATVHATACLKLGSDLLDYNTINASPSYPFPLEGKSNVEVIFYNQAASTSIISATRMIVNPTFYSLYENADLRRALFFRTQSSALIFKGSYSGGTAYFSGLALDEVYLNLAECLARNGKDMEALNYLNTLRQHRFRPEEFQALSNLGSDELLLMILEERKRQLYFRGLRWEDLRRLNKEAKHQTALVRTVNGVAYRLEPGSVRWTWPIFPTAVQNGGYIQNPR